MGAGLDGNGITPKGKEKTMKKLFVFLVITAFIGVMIGMGWSGSADPKIAVINKGVNNKSTVDYLNEDDLTSDSDGAVASQQSIKAYVDNDEGRISRVVVLDDLSDFSTWAGNTASDADSGSSYYQMVANSIYIVDAIAIMNSTTGLLSPLSTRGGVTLHLPLATATNDYQTVEVMWAQRDSGTSATQVAFELYVASAPLAGTTSYAGTGAITAKQNMTGMATSGSSTITTFSIGPSYNINSVGESGVWMLMNDSATSAIYKREGGIFP